jgi:molybdopterin-guanine dinucleotide biosynthesis protein MobB
VAATRIISIIGRKNAGKTTLTVALASELARRRHRVMSMKHADHPAQVDQPGVDSWRHFHEGRAERVLLVSPEMRVLFHRALDEYNPIGLVREHLSGADIVLIEGFKGAPLPKIEVYRRAVAPRPIYDPAAANAEDWVAIVTDDYDFESDRRVLRFNDTMWLQLLANLAWEHALVVET